MNEILYEEALKAINKLYSDTSITQAEALLNLENLKEEIDLLIETLDTDEKND